MSGFDCDVVIFLLLVATKWADIACSVSQTLSIQSNRTYLKISIAVFALGMSIYACTILENHIDIVETIVCYWQFAKYSFKAYLSWAEKPSDKYDFSTKSYVISVATDLVSFLLFVVAYFVLRDNTDLVFYGTWAENPQKIETIQKKLSLLIFLIISFDELVIIAAGKYMMSSKSPTVYTIGAAIGTVMNWAIAGIIFVFY